jgi:DNA-binding MarR family transcriptional regulator
MIDNSITFFQNVGDTLIGAVLWPGQQTIAAIVFYSPAAAKWLALNEAEPPVLMTFMFSLVVWFLVIVVITLVGRFLRNLVRTIEAIARTIAFRVKLFVRETQTMFKLKWRRLQFWRKADEPAHAAAVELDDIDVAVLQSASGRGPGFAVSAPELAEQFRLRPAQVQRSLKKLSACKMLDYVIGSTDGYDNFRLTDYGAAYVATWNRRTASA